MPFIVLRFVVGDRVEASVEEGYVVPQCFLTADGSSCGVLTTPLIPRSLTRSLALHNLALSMAILQLPTGTVIKQRDEGNPTACG